MPIDIPVFLYQLFGALFVSIVPIILIIAIVWLLVKIGKSAVRSILK